MLRRSWLADGLFYCCLVAGCAFGQTTASPPATQPQTEQSQAPLSGQSPKTSKVTLSLPAFDGPKSVRIQPCRVTFVVSTESDLLNAKVVSASLDKPLTGFPNPEPLELVELQPHDRQALLYTGSIAHRYVGFHAIIEATLLLQFTPDDNVSNDKGTPHLEVGARIHLFADDIETRTVVSQDTSHRVISSTAYDSVTLRKHWISKTASARLALVGPAGTPLWPGMKFTTKAPIDNFSVDITPSPPATRPTTTETLKR